METILMTGGTGLIGTAQVKHFLAQGYRVITTYRSEDKLQAFHQHTNLLCIKVPDILEPNAALRIISELERMNAFPEHLVNMACDSRWHKMEENGMASRECMLNHYISNVVFPYELSFHIANHPKSKLKKIINISSMYGVVPYDPHLYNNPKLETPLQYSLSKSALIHLTKELAIRLRDRDIMVNTVSYGGVDGRTDDAFKERFKRVTPLERMMLPEETVDAIEFLIKDKSHYMTGQNIIVDGGRTIW